MPSLPHAHLPMVAELSQPTALMASVRVGVDEWGCIDGCEWSGLFGVFSWVDDGRSGSTQACGLPGSRTQYRFWSPSSEGAADTNNAAATAGVQGCGWDGMLPGCDVRAAVAQHSRILGVYGSPVI
jgi:hypothetical protein